MSNELSSQRMRVLLAAESTYGTDAVETVLTTTTEDIIYQEVDEPTATPERALVEFARARASASGNKHRTVEVRAPVSGSFPMTGRRGAAAGQEAPIWDPLAGAMSLNKAVVASTSCTYTLSTLQQAACTWYQYHRQLESDDWRLVVVTGVRGTSEITFGLDEETIINFTGTGLYQQVLSDRAEYFSAGTLAANLLKDGLTSVSARTGGATEFIADQDTILGRALSITVDGVVFPLQSLSLALNWTQSEIRTLNASTGVTKVLNTRASTGARVGGSFSLIDGADALDKLLDLYEDGSEVAFDCVATSNQGTSGDDRITLNAPKCQLGVFSTGDSDGVMTFDVPYFFNGDFSSLAGDNELSLTIDVVP